MFVKIHKTTAGSGIRNHKGSSFKLVAYLRDLCSRSEEYYDTFFSQEESHVVPVAVMRILGRNVTEFRQLTVKEQEKVIDELKIFAVGCMDLYARNFRREKVESGKDIVWFGRIGNARYYKGTDRDVKEGRAKTGDRKPELHIHIIVSRNDVTQTVSLSPLAKSRGSFNTLDGKKVLIGFDRTYWSEWCAQEFMERYGRCIIQPG